MSPAISAAPASDIVLTFSETIARGSGLITLKNAAGATVASFDAASSTQLSLSGSRLVIDPSAELDYGTQYTLSLAAGSVLDTAGNAGMAYRLYQAAFDRTPDQGGLGFQMKALDDGLNIAQVAANFIASPEFQRTYGALNDTQFVTQLYQNVLHRAPDSGGLAFHVNNLATGANTRANVLVGFSESPENQAALIGAIQNGMVYTV